MRELTDEEKAFIDLALDKKGHSIEESEDDVEKAPKKKIRRRYFPWRFVSYVCTAIFILPFLFVGLFFYGLNRVANVLGHDTLVDLSQKSDADLTKLGQQAGVSELPRLAELYRSRDAIVAGSFSIAIGIIVIVLLVSLFISSRKKFKNDIA